MAPTPHACSPAPSRRQGYRCPGRARSRDAHRRRRSSYSDGRRRAGASCCDRPATSPSRTGPCCSARWPRAPRVVPGLSDRRRRGAPLAAVEALGRRRGAPRATGPWSSTEAAPGCTRAAGPLDLRQFGNRHAPPGRSGGRLRRETALVGDDVALRAPDGPGGRALGLMGATVRRARQSGACRPCAIAGGVAARASTTRRRWPAPRSKSAILLAGLSADAGPTVVREPVTTRAHTEEMLAEAGADITVEHLGRRPRRDGPAPRASSPWTARCPATLRRRPSSWLPDAWCQGARSMSPASTAVPPGSGTSSVLQRMGADVDAAPRRTGHGDASAPRPDRCTRTEVRASEIPSLDEIPALAVAAAVAEGTTDLLRRRRAPGEGGRPAGGGGRHGRGLRCIRHGRGRRPSRSTAWAAAPRCPFRQSAATTGWPWPPPWPGWPPARRTQPGDRVRCGRDQLPGLRRGRAALDRPRRAPSPARRHRRPRRRGQVDRVDRGGRTPRRRPPRHGGHVPGRGRPRPGARGSTGRRGRGGRPRRGLGDRGRGAGRDRRAGRHRRHPLARGGTGRVGRGRQPRGPASPGAAPAGLGGRARGRCRRRHGTSAQWCSRRPRSRST